MKLKKLHLFFLCIISSFLYSQNDLAQLPYSKNVIYPKKSTPGTVMAKMVDELGYKYYWSTDSLLNDDLRYTFNSNNVPRLLLEGVYQMSKNVIDITSENKMKPEVKLEEMSFEDFRKHTLLNLKKASSILIENKEAALFLDWDLFMKSIAISDAYCDQIISFRKSIGIPFKLKDHFTEQKLSKSKVFDQSLGADGLTTKQWMKIMERSGGPIAADKIRSEGKNNQQIIFKLRKEERATVTVGNLETIKLSSNSVDGLTYTSFNEPPAQLSFLFSNDKELVEGMIDWIIYINSGHPSNFLKCSELVSTLLLALTLLKINHLCTIDTEISQI
jgi:hypothetical protein